MTKTFGRVAYVQIASQLPPEKMKGATIELLPYKDLKWETIRGLDIKFDISKPIFSLQQQATISILGLSMDKIQQYASWGGEATMFKRAVLIRVYAGYGDSDEDAQLIFEGNIVNAMPTMPPDVWLNIQARTLDTQMKMTFTKDITEAANTADRTMSFAAFTTLVGRLTGTKQIMTGFPSENGMSQINIPLYEKPVTVEMLLHDFQKICEHFNTVFYITTEDDGTPVMVFDRIIHEDGFSPDSSQVIKISKDTGMIGIPKMKFNQIEVTCLLTKDATNRLLGYADVTSRFAFPGLYNWKGDIQENIYHALFRIWNIRYHGHLRGNEWYATYTAQRDTQKGDML